VVLMLQLLLLPSLLLQLAVSIAIATPAALPDCMH